MADEQPLKPEGGASGSRPPHDSDAAYAETHRIPQSFAEPVRPESQRFRITGILGEGGMATVYEGQDKALNRSVAVKVLKPEMAGDQEMVCRFFSEAELLAQMDHPGIVPVFEVGDFPVYGAYYAMKKIRGKTFREILAALDCSSLHRRDTQTELLRTFEKVCLTVAYAHAHGIIHRDLKPENIMVDDYGVVLVMDWGLSKQIDRPTPRAGMTPTRVGIVQGTPGYMSPEQAGGRTDEIDYRTDVFALGIILYEILTGELPFSGKTHTDVMREVVQREPASPRSLNRRADRVLSAVCMKALSKDPGGRYPTAKEMAEDIRSARDLLPTTAFRPGPMLRLRNWAGRHPVTATALATTIVLACVFGALGYHRSVVREMRSQHETRAAELADAMHKQRTRDRYENVLGFVEGLGMKIRALDEEILSADAQIAAGATDEAEMQLAQARRAELRTARAWNSEYAKALATSLVIETSEFAGADPALRVPGLMENLRKLMLQEIRSLLEIGEYYEVHYQIWHYLVRSSRYNWTPEETSELLQLNTQVEEMLRKARPDGAALPDWSKYDPGTPFPDVE